MSVVEASPAEPDRVERTDTGRRLLLLSFAVVLLLTGSTLWRGASERSFKAGKGIIHLRPGLSPDEKMTAYVDSQDMPKAMQMYAELTGRELVPSQASWSQRLDRHLNRRLTRWGLVKGASIPDSGICYHRDGRFSAIEIKEVLENFFQSVGLCPVPEGEDCFRLVRKSPVKDSKD